MRRASTSERKDQEHEETDTLGRMMDKVIRKERSRLKRSTWIRACLIYMFHCLNGMDFSREEFWDNLCLWYGLIPLNLPTDCSGFKKKFTVDHTLPCPKEGLLLVSHDDTTNEWGALGGRVLTPSAIYYEPHINSRMVQGGRTGSGERVK